jgi:HEAT repeat protein
MSCERFRERIPECLAGRLEGAARAELVDHLAVCAACSSLVAEMGAVWRGLDSPLAAEPDPAMRRRFLEVLEAYRAGMEQPRGRGWRAAGWWPARAVWQTALAMALLMAGGLAERYLVRPRVASPEIAQLQGQVESLRELVALSMLRDQSPSSRIYGVTYGSQMARPGRPIEQAMLYAVNHDANVNVRLSAVDALEKLAGDPGIRRALADALPMQDSPLVETAIVDVLVRANGTEAVPVLRRLVRDEQADESVRQWAAAGVRKLEVSK